MKNNKLNLLVAMTLLLAVAGSAQAMKASQCPQSHSVKAKLAATLPLSINAASAAALVKRMKGVSHKRATSIVAYREQHGPFADWEALSKVRGISKHLVTRYLAAWKENGLTIA